jgi:hypothetical protein
VTRGRVATEGGDGRAGGRRALSVRAPALCSSCERRPSCGIRRSRTARWNWMSVRVRTRPPSSPQRSAAHRRTRRNAPAQRDGSGYVARRCEGTFSRRGAANGLHRNAPRRTGRTRSSIRSRLHSSPATMRRSGAPSSGALRRWRLVRPLARVLGRSSSAAQSSEVPLQPGICQGEDTGCALPMNWDAQTLCRSTRTSVSWPQAATPVANDATRGAKRVDEALVRHRRRHDAPLIGERAATRGPSQRKWR